jgi:hypothetical protein
MTQRKHKRLPTDPIFEAGDRVRLRRDICGFAKGTVGTIARSTPRIYYSDKGRHVSYYVVFNEPQDNGSGYGPYSGCACEGADLDLVQWAL